MSRLFYHIAQDNAGNLLFDVSGTMRLAGTGTLATIYGDEALTVILPNPMTNHPSYGSFKCFLGAGDYDFYMAKSGYTFETLTGVQGHGTMAQQDASAVAITGGSATNMTTVQTRRLNVQDTAGDGAIGLFSDFQNAGGANRFFLFHNGNAPSQVGGALTVLGQASVLAPVGIGGAPEAAFNLRLGRNKSTMHGLKIAPSGSDTGGTYDLAFLNVAGTVIGSITSDASATAFNTASDSRLKTAVQSLVGELAVIRALRPVRFRWLVDDSEGVGFIASEVAEHVQGVVTGEADAVDEEGQIVPQMIDMSKLVPWLCGALQTLAAQVETLAERVQALEEGLGV